MRVPFSDMRAEYMDTPERKVLDLRRDGLTEVPSLGWAGYLHARPDLPVHRHFGVLEIHFLEWGRQVFEVEGREYELHGGDIFVTQPGESHSTSGKPVEPGVLYWLQIRLPESGRAFFSLPPKEAAAMVKALRSLPARHLRARSRAKAIFSRLLDLHFRPKTALRLTRMRQTIVDLLLEVIDNSNSVQPIHGDRGSVMWEVARTIQGSPSKDFRVEELARLAGYSLSWFKQAFKEQIGISPRQFVLRTKIDVACRRLVSGTEPINWIASDLGFETAEYFATVFRRLKHVSPRQYRENKTALRSGSHRKEDGQV